MKKIASLFLILSVSSLFCNGSSTKKVFIYKNILDSLKTEDKVICDSIRLEKPICDSVRIENPVCDSVRLEISQKNPSKALAKKTPQKTKTNRDDIVYNMPTTAAKLENPIKYFKANNMFKNWNKRSHRIVIIRCIAEKDGRTSNVKILKGDFKDPQLNKEAVRLIKLAKLTPARNEKNEIIRSYFTINIHFPAQ
jgi:TonB family protein